MHPSSHVNRAILWGCCVSACLFIAAIGWRAMQKTCTKPAKQALSVVKPPTQASQPLVLTTPQASKTVRLLDWNVYMLPLPMGYAHDPSCRARGIASKVSTFGADIITFNEATNKLHMSSAVRTLKSRYPHQINSVPAAKGRTKFNGGLSVLSKHPITHTHIQAFKSCQGSDCVMNKGFVHALIEVDRGHKLNVINTHLNSGFGQKNQDTRLEQVKEIMAYTKKSPHIAQWPTVLVGDLNVNGVRHSPFKLPPNTSQLNDYGQLMKAMGNTCVENPGSQCVNVPMDTMRELRGKWNFTPSATAPLNSLNCVGPTMTSCVNFNELKFWLGRQRFDYVLEMGPPSKAPGKRAKVTRTAFEPWKGSNCEGNYLSDHKALSSTIVLP